RYRGGNLGRSVGVSVPAGGGRHPTVPNATREEEPSATARAEPEPEPAPSAAAARPREEPTAAEPARPSSRGPTAVAHRLRGAWRTRGRAVGRARVRCPGNPRTESAGPGPSPRSRGGPGAPRSRASASPGRPAPEPERGFPTRGPASAPARRPEASCLLA